MAIESQGQIREALVALLGGNSDAAKTLIEGTFKVKYKVDKQADAAASTAASWALEYSNPARFKATAVRFVPHASLTGDGTNNAVLSLVTNDGAGGSDTTIATLTTTASWTANVHVEIPITAANAVINSALQIQFRITKGGTGVVVPAGSLIVNGQLV